VHENRVLLEQQLVIEQFEQQQRQLKQQQLLFVIEFGVVKQ